MCENNYILRPLLQTVESIKEQLFYKSRKLRYKSLLSLQLNGVVIDTLIQGIATTTFQIGVACILLYPRGTCSCGYLEVVDGVQVKRSHTTAECGIEKRNA